MSSDLSHLRNHARYGDDGWEERSQSKRQGAGGLTDTETPHPVDVKSRLVLEGPQRTVSPEDVTEVHVGRPWEGGGWSHVPDPRRSDHLVSPRGVLRLPHEVTLVGTFPINVSRPVPYPVGTLRHTLGPDLRHGRLDATGNQDLVVPFPV